MTSSPISSGLSTPQKIILKEAEEDMEEEQLEDQEEEVEENEDDEEMEENIPNEAITEIDPELTKLDVQANTPEALSYRQLPRNRKVYPQKVLGTTILPVTRVNRAAKQDKDIKIVSKEAVFLISIATEYFVKKLTDSAFERCQREKRVFVRYNDVAMAVKKNPEYDWLEEVIPTSLPLGTLLRDPTIPSASTSLTNKLPTEMISNQNETSTVQSEPTQQAKLVSPPESKLKPALESAHDDNMDMNDEDELDEELD